MKWFLKLKHWQLFLLTFVIPLVTQVFFVSSIFRDITAQSVSGMPMDPMNMLSNFSYFPILIFYVMFLHFGWYWSVGVKLGNKIPDELKLKTGMFKAFLIIPVVCICLLSLVFNLFLTQIAQNQFMPNPALFWVPFAIFPLNLMNGIFMIYCIYFTARTIKTAELQKSVRFDEFVGDFFAILFFPIGVWIVQPIINKMVEEVNPYDPNQYIKL